MRDEEIVADPTQPLPERIAAGARLWDSIQAHNAALDLLKEDLRKLALQTQKTPGTVTVDGEGLSRALIVIQPPNLSLKKGADPAAYRADFGRSFALLFSETKGWKLKPNAEAILLRLPRPLQTLVFRLVEESELKPRVYFESAGKGVETL